MVSLNCISISKLNILASKSLPNKTSSPSNSIPQQASSSSPNPNASFPSLNTASPESTPPKLRQQQQKQPSIMEIERAIGAGIYKDREPGSIRESEENETLFDTIFSRTIGKTEGSLEKQLRETGEWINDKTERKLRSAGKPILVFMYQWILPMWILAFCVAFGIIKLPFHNAFLDDLLM